MADTYTPACPRLHMCMSHFLKTSPSPPVRMKRACWPPQVFRIAEEKWSLWTRLDLGLEMEGESKGLNMHHTQIVPSHYSFKFVCGENPAYILPSIDSLPIPYFSAWLSVVALAEPRPFNLHIPSPSLSQFVTFVLHVVVHGDHSLSLSLRQLLLHWQLLVDW